MAESARFMYPYSMHEFERRYKLCALNGSSVPSTIIELSKKKVITGFVDGDRGGDLIIRELLGTAEIDFVSKAPDGKEVEEITKKEIHKALRSRITIEQFKMEMGVLGDRIAPRLQPIMVQDKRSSTSSLSVPRKPEVSRPSAAQPEETKKFKQLLDDLVGTRGAYVLDKDYNILGKVPITELETTLKNVKNAFAVVFDGSITKEIAKSAEANNLNFVVATSSKIRPNETKVTILTQRDL